MIKKNTLDTHTAWGWNVCRPPLRLYSSNFLFSSTRGFTYTLMGTVLTCMELYRVSLLKVILWSWKSLNRFTITSKFQSWIQDVLSCHKILDTGFHNPGGWSEISSIQDFLYPGYPVSRTSWIQDVLDTGHDPGYRISWIQDVLDTGHPVFRIFESWIQDTLDTGLIESCI